MTVTIEDMGLVDHTCLIPDSVDHLWETTARWMASGLQAGERVIYFENDTAAAVLGRLADDHVPVRDAIAEGQLVMVPGDVVRAVSARPVDGIVEVIREQIMAATITGWPGVRLAGESWGMLRHGGMGKVVDYERAVDHVLREHPSARMLCRYDRRYFDDAAVTALRAVHRTELVTPAVYDDTLLRVTSTGPSGLRLAGEVDHSNRPEIRRVLAATLDEALRSHSAPTDITVDITSLRFLDVGGAVALVHTAEEFPETHRLIVVGARPRIVRILDRCGAPFAPRLQVRPHEGG